MERIDNLPLEVVFAHQLARPNKAFQRDEIAVSHPFQNAQKLRHSNFAAEQRR